MSSTTDPSWNRFRRRVGVTGLAAVPLLFAPTIALSTLGEPQFEGTADEVVTFLATIRNTSWAEAAMVLQSAAVLVLLWWAVTFTHVMRREEGEPSWRSTAALASIVVFTGGIVLQPSWATAAQLEDLDPGLALFAFDAGNIGFANAWLALGSFAAASGWVIVHTRMLSPALGWMAVASAAGFLTARFVWTSGFWFAPYALFWIWVVAVCIALLRGRATSSMTTPAEVGATSPIPQD